MKKLSPCLVLFALLIAGCDTAGPDETATSAPVFEATLIGAVDTSLEGTATLGAEFGVGTFLTLQLPPIAFLPERTLTATRLRDTGEATTHEISLVYIGDDRLAPGVYDANLYIDPSVLEECRGANVPPACIRDALGPHFSTSYTRRTTDSLYSYPISLGQITIETASEDLIEGSFQLKADFVMAVSLKELAQFREAMSEWNHEWENFPPLPDYNRRPLSPPLTIEGTFTATSVDVPPLGN